MRNNRLLKAFVSTVFLTAIFTGCSNSVNSMLDSYNGQFTPVYTSETSTVLNPGDEGFNEKSMLLDKYVVSNYATLNLCAPLNCSSYHWIIEDPESGDLEPVKVKTMSGTSDVTRRFVFYVKDSRVADPYGQYVHNGVTGGKTYRLTLNVLTDDGSHYTDYSTLAIYNDYYFETGIVTIPPGATTLSRSAVVQNLTSTVNCNARSILPSTPDIDSSEFHYYLSGKNLLTNQDFTSFEVKMIKDDSDASNKTGTFEFDLPKGNYWLTLTAFDSEPTSKYAEALIGSCQYIGFSSVDNRYNNSASFVLRPSTNGFGHGLFHIYSMGWDINSSIFEGVEIATALTDYEGNPVSPGEPTTLKKSNMGSGSAPVYSNYEINIEPGVYILTISFSIYGKTYQWSDNLTIVPNTTTEANIGIPPLIDLGQTEFKLFTDGWDFTESVYNGYTSELTITKASNGDSVTNYIPTTYFNTANMNTVPQVVNFGLLNEIGDYYVNLSFSKDYKKFTSSHKFSVQQGISYTELFPVKDVIPTGLANFKIYTDGWDFNDSKYASYKVNGVNLSVTDEVTGKTVPISVTVPFSEASLTDTVPGSANYGIKAEPGTYKLNVSFTNNSQTYTWSYQFTVEAGSTTTETVGISSSVIPAGS